MDKRGIQSNTDEVDQEEDNRSAKEMALNIE